MRRQGKCRLRERRRVFSTFLECCNMSGVFYHSVIHGSGFFICFMIQILRNQNNKTRFFYVLYSDKTWIFNQSERAQGPIYIFIKFKTRLQSINPDMKSFRNVMGIKHTASAAFVCFLASFAVQRKPKNFMSFSYKHVSVLHLYQLIFNTQSCILFRISASGFFLKYSQTFANLSLGILISNI